MFDLLGSTARGSQLLPRVYEILVILASKYMGLMGDSGASVRDSAVILQSVAGPSQINDYLFKKSYANSELHSQSRNAMVTNFTR